MSKENAVADPDWVDAPVKEESGEVKTEAPKTTKKKVFSRKDIVRSIKFQVHLPILYPDFEPWGFNLRLKMSQDAEERRQEYLALAPTDQTVKEDGQYLDELCDLLIETPTGFGDIADDGRGPGSSFKNYVTTSEPDAQAILFNIVKGAMTLYWRKISPHEFRPTV
jgi:hypothetical protein